VIYLTLAELVYIAERATGGQVTMRDAGLLEAAAARPRATAFGADAYPDLHAKAAALVHSLARNHAFVDGNKRLALGALVAFCGINGLRLALTNDAAYELIMQVAVGELDSVEEIAAILKKSTGPRP
jgi:death-on-curing protein